MAPPPYLTAQNIKLSFGVRPLFEGLIFSLYKGEKVCLVGRNGSGKSTLLKTLAGIIEPDEGDLFIQPGLKVAYLPQDVQLPGHLTPLEYISQTGIDHFMAASYLDQLKMDGTQPMQYLSGGECRRIALAHALAENADILLLDEPTNHMDLPAIEWLEDFVLSFQGALVTISHDRSFLEKVSNRTYWLDQGQLHAHKKGYADFEQWSEELIAEEERQLQKMDTKLRQEQEWLHRGVTARRKRNQGRLRKLHELRNQRREREKNKPGQLNLSTSEGDVSSKLIMEAKNISKAYGDKCLIKNFSTRILRGDRIGVIGANGSGKTTLLKLLVKQLEPDIGSVRLGSKVDLVYFDQMRSTLKSNESLWQNLCPTGGDQVYVGGHHRHVMAYLKDFLFEEKQVRGLVSILSGGEKNRLALAKALAQPSNVLVLDEPTNDLDMDTLDLLVEMLSDYEGTIIVVSHDRDFLNKTVTSLIAVEGDGLVEEYVGGYDDYLCQRKLPPHTFVPKPKPPKKSAIKEQRGKISQPSKRLSYSQQRLLDSLPSKMASLEREIDEIEQKLADPVFYTRYPQEFSKLSERLEQARKALVDAEETWLKLEVT